MSSYYNGMRKFALGGKGWTIVLGTTFSMTYVKWRAKLLDEDRSQAYHDLKDERGDTVRFADQGPAPEKHEDIVIQLYRKLPSVPLPNLYLVAGCLTAFWAYRAGNTFNKLMIVRYSDIGYQLRRPDVLANKVVALKYLFLPLAVIPGCALFAAGLSWATRSNGVDENGNVIPLSPLQQHAWAVRELIAMPCREVGQFMRNETSQFHEEMSNSNLAIFAKRSQSVGRPYSMVQIYPGQHTEVPAGQKARF